ncbi:hypothetical protein [Streptomyces sp. sk2.1]|uniref:hypothetical protein n=1 Tax=Streptomyces sp. sk2.1 TaxID=2478959 RepID=UPI0011E71DD3|nr:hypothetical protein [Streptomyces sp. sk2.1]TXS76171.1 hypothetical protein EAO76_11295 [Streptomyces sp. sk2.1]
MITSNSSTSSLRRFFSLFAVVSVLGTGLLLTAVVQGAVDGPRWLLLLALPATALALTAFGKVAESATSGLASPGLRAAGPRAFAPAVVNGVKAVNRADGRSVADGRAGNSVFVFDLTVVADDLPPYRIEVRHPLDLQGLLHKSRAVVEYDPEQPWRVVVPNNPPREWLARAQVLTAPTGEVRTSGGGTFPTGSRTLAAGVVLAAVLLVLIRVLG